MTSDDVHRALRRAQAWARDIQPFADVLFILALVSCALWWVLR